ncbi:hypothetical protein M408DRAFT_210000 [Serendipita vermifera MAFF 305830]|uniref:P-loop containing nucleoside triphosphate hydrolase protein n=1 Tax=Serendipita vermifera MAFF 305830 TaxID=933852 RepID=A0A0C2WG30_SERVB|nr:hypothetical protein M408DRAFT_210000 [Serendipita vermifera MAFF 305830]
MAMRLTLPIASLSLLETIFWTGSLAYALSLHQEVTTILVAACQVVSWGYTFIRPLARPSVKPPIDLFLLLLIQLTTATIMLFGHAYDRYAVGTHWPSSAWPLLADLADTLIITTLLVIIMSTPLEPIDPKDSLGVDNLASPEDYTTIWGWMTFAFVNPVIEKGTRAPLVESDVFELSPHHRADPLLRRFAKVKGKTLLRRIWTANALDLLMDGLLTLVSVVFNYAGPFFLKRILDAISEPSPEAIAQAYVYATLTLFCSLVKNQADMQHLWYGRQAVTRTRSILMAAVFDKAMKRKDFSGVTVPSGKNGKGGGSSKPISIKKAALESMGKKAKTGGKAGGSGADIGKIVNLMSGDASKTAQILGQVYNLYGAPFELIVGTFFLYRLLGYAAFVGFIALLSIAPINHYLSKRRIFISRGISAARDRRMAVVNELFVSVKFIKLCAWDERWIERCEKARAKEIKWILRERGNSIMLAFIWTCAPILVSVFSFMAFVAQGKELTVSIAFTSIVLFNLLRQPLNVLPNFLAQLLQAKVSLDRISQFFAEDEVDEQISTLKRRDDVSSVFQYDATLGITGGATFVWNSVQPAQTPNPPAVNGQSLSNGQGPTTDEEQEPGSPTDSDPSVTEARFELRDIDVIFPEGKLTVVTGPTASGKTALLLAQLGEMTMQYPASSSEPTPKIHIPKQSHGPVDEHGFRACVSYAAQSPWLEHLSIRDNILFGEPFDSERYWDVIESCALRADLDILEDGDFTEIGERGISLSGGQKARVALARAVYAPSKIVLLDDPLSAVDSHTARFLYERLFMGPLLANRTVVLVTHHVELVLPGAYYYIQMQDGRMEVQGTVQELQEEGLLEDLEVNLVDVKPGLSSLEDDEEGHALDEKLNDPAGWHKSPDKVPTPGPDRAWIQSQQAREKHRKKPRKMIEEEARQIGGVQWSIYETYLRASGYWTWAIILCLIGVAQLFGFFEKFWIKVWGESYDDAAPSLFTQYFVNFPSIHLSHSHVQAPIGQATTLHPFHVNPSIYGVDSTSLPSASKHPLYYVAIYGAIGFGGVVITTLYTIVQYSGAVRASRLLFTRLLSSLVHATMRWHDVTPTGRILNRLSRDMEVLDSSLSGSLRAVMFRLATFFASIVTVAYVFPLFLIPASIISYLYARISKGYISAGRDMRRMQSTTRSPIFAGFAETLEGIVTVRAFGAERRFLSILLRKIDLTTKMWYGWWMMNRWLLLRFDALGAFSIFIITLFALSGYISGGWAGITITSAMQFTVSVYWTCRLATQLELDLNSVERVVEYLDLPQEPPLTIPGKSVPESWPSNTALVSGAVGGGTSNENPSDFIKVENLIIRYSPELPPVLHSVSFSLKAGEKVGLLGRTGSGKSTLAMSLLRFVDPSSGKIWLDGLDITAIGLKDLRSRVTIIPQDSVLFSGSLRENLDPFEEHDDSECLDALYRVHLLTPGARVRAPTLVQGSNSNRPSMPTITILDRPLTPEPDSLHPVGSADVDKLHTSMTRDTLPVQATTESPSRAGTPLVLDYGAGRSTLTDMLNFRFGGGVESGAVSPTGALSPLRHKLPSVSFANMERYSGDSGTATPEREQTNGLRTMGFTPAGRANTMVTGSNKGTRASFGQDRGDAVEAPLLTLDTRVASGGANFSSGQRQLVSLARALLRRNKVVILDEATSSIDFETDAKIQATVREEFGSSCLLTIAHRIRTVIDYDKLIVLDKGRIVEMDTPWKLIQKEGGLFRDMCVKSGQMRELESMAKAKFMSEGRAVFL